MTFWRRPLLLLVVLLLLVLGFLYLGLGSSYGSGGARAFDLFPVAADRSVPGGMAGDATHEDAAEEDLPPESTLSFGGMTLASEGEILGFWEPPGFFSHSNGSGVRSRAAVPLTLTDGEILKVPAGATLKFRYGGEVDLGRDVFDVLAFGISDGEFARAEDAGTGELSYLEALPEARPLPLPVEVPEMSGQRAVRAKTDVPPGVYVVSVSASVEQGNVRYNFRVLVGE